MITGNTAYLTILAHPSGRVTAPLVYNHIFKALDLDMAYIAHDVAPAALQPTIESFRLWENLKGFNVTIPHKEAASGMLDSICPVSRQTGAVNTVVRDSNGKLHGYNTDGDGALKAIGPARDATCLVLGAGGAAKAIIAALLNDGARKVYLLNRSRERAEATIAALGDDRLALWDRAELSEIDILVQTTPLDQSVPFDLALDTLDKGATVFEAIMHPTALAEQCRELGLKLVPGHAMLYYQTKENFRLFIGEDLDDQLLDEAFARIGYERK